MNKTVVVVQARMRSERLPGKVMKQFAGRPMLQFLLDRLRLAKSVDTIIVAIPDGKADDRLARALSSWDAEVHRGPEEDVLTRVMGAVQLRDAEVVVRVTADNPFTDPDILDGTVAALKQQQVDYLCPAGVPTGTATEAIRLEALDRAFRTATAPEEREHVTLHICRRPDEFRIGHWQVDLGTIIDDLVRLTVDEPRDLKMVRKLAKHLGPYACKATLPEILTVFAERPGLAEINRFVEQRVFP